MSISPAVSRRHLASLAGIVSLGLFTASTALAGTPAIYYGGNSSISRAANFYHSQITSFYCGAAAIQMQLDSTAWSGSTSFAPATLHLQSTQNAIYTVSHGASGPNWFTDPTGLTAALNNYTAPGTFVQHDDAPVVPVPASGIRSWNTAGRNIANALELTGAPVSILINNSAHWIDVNAVLTNVAPTVNGAYTIYGFYVRDPWPLAGTLGANSYLANNGRAFGRFYTPAAPQAGAPWSGKYVSITDPPASDVGTYGSEPLDAPIIPDISAATAAADAGNDTADTAGDSTNSGSTDDSDLFTVSGMDTPADFIAGDAMLEHFGDDTSTQGDWLVPYETSPGVVSGFELVDEETGLLDQATWFDPSSPTMDLSDLYTDVADEFDGGLVNDAMPEPTSLALIAIAAPLLLRRRRSC